MLFNRIIGVFKLDVDTFEEIEADQSATGQAAMVVLIVAIISAIGGGVGSTISGSSFFGGFIGNLLSIFAGWIIWSFVTYIVGTMIFKGEADLGEMLRVIGFAYAPQILSIIPCIGWLVGAIWTLIAVFIAIRQGLDLDNTKAFLTIIVGFIAYVIVIAIIELIFGGLGAVAGSIF